MFLTELLFNCRASPGSTLSFKTRILRDKKSCGTAKSSNCRHRHEGISFPAATLVFRTISNTTGEKAYIRMRNRDDRGYAWLRVTILNVDG